MNKTVKKTLKITGIVLGSLVAAVLILYAVLWIIRGIKYDESMKLRQNVCLIPGINDGFVPQGIGYSEEQDLYVMSGYDGDKRTMMYIVKDGVSRQVFPADEEGYDLLGHGGGVTCAKDNVYVATDSALQIYSLRALMESADGERVRTKGMKPVDNGAAFCFSDSTRLFVGEFYREGNYETDKAHYFTTPANEENKAIVSCYDLDGDGNIIGDYPEYSISITGLVQGFATSGDKYILSRSYGLSDSKLEYHAAPKDAGTTVRLSFKRDESLADVNVPLYYLDSSTMTRSLTLPSFSEDLTIVGDRVVVTNEAACNKYFIGKLFGAINVHSYPLDI